MAETISFPSNGSEASGYLVRPEGGSGPGILVIQEWWGLDSGIKEMASRLAAAGFVALAPDLYHGELAQHDEMDKASQLMQSMPPGRAASDMSGAIDYLAGLDGVNGRGIGVVGFCMGGMLSFYGFPAPEMEPDWSNMSAVIRGHMAEHDDFFTPEMAKALEAKLQGMGKDITLTIHPGTGHAFMGPHNALGTLNEELASVIWPQVLTFLHEQLD